MQNATAHLFAVGDTGYGMNPTLLSGTSTLSNGTFGFSLFSCEPANEIVYISVVIGTTTGTGNNSGLSLLTMLGPCNQIANPTDIAVNEVTTAASTYAMQQFMSTVLQANQIGAPFLNPTGIANAAAVVENIVNVNTGAAPGPALPSGATAPASEINTLANIIAPCVSSVDTGGHASAACEELFCDATPGATFSTMCSVTPTIKDTLGAMLSIARNPTNNITALFDLATHNSPYSPSLGAAPNDWTMALNYIGGGLKSPFFIAIDSLGDPWITNSEGGSVTKLSPTGVALSGSGGFTTGGIDSPRGIAIDSSNDVWIGNGNSTLTELDVNGNSLSGSGGYSGGGLGEAYGVAIDPQQNVWVSAGAKLAKFCGNTPANCPMGVTTGDPISPSGGFTGGGLTDGFGVSTDASSSAWIANSGPTSGSPSAVCKFDLNGNALSGAGGFTGGGLLSPTTYTIIDPAGRSWTTNIGNASVTELSNSGTPISGSGGFTGGGINNSESLASDSANDIWITNEESPVGSISELNSVGAPISGSSGFQGGGLNDPIGIAIDASGNVWTANDFDNSVTQFLGAAAPTHAPLNGPAAAP